MTARWAKRQATFHTHEFLWSDLEDLWRLIEDEPQAARGVFTGTLVLLFACFEAHLNFLGETLFPDIWKQTRLHFGRPPHRGTLGKLAYLAAKLSLPLDRSRKPYSTVAELQRRRHMLVHPLVENREHRVEFKDASELRLSESRYDRIATQRFLLRARAAVQEMADRLQKAAFEQFPGKVFGQRAFSGFLGVRGVSIES
jgi:hypothetical protein